MPYNYETVYMRSSNSSENDYRKKKHFWEISLPPVMWVILRGELNLKKNECPGYKYENTE